MCMSLHMSKTSQACFITHFLYYKKVCQTYYNKVCKIKCCLSHSSESTHFVFKTPKSKLQAKVEHSIKMIFFSGKSYLTIVLF